MKKTLLLLLVCVLAVSVIAAPGGKKCHKKKKHAKRHAVWTRYEVVFSGDNGDGVAEVTALNDKYEYSVTPNESLSNGDIVVIKATKIRRSGKHDIHEKGAKEVEIVVSGLLVPPVIVLEGTVDPVKDPRIFGTGSAMGGAEYIVEYDGATGMLTFNIKPLLPPYRYKIQAFFTGITLEDGTNVADIVWGSAGYDWSENPKYVDAGDGWYSYSLDASSYAGQTLGVFYNIIIREDDARNIERFFGISPMIIFEDWDEFDFSWTNRLKIELP